MTDERDPWGPDNPLKTPRVAAIILAVDRYWLGGGKWSYPFINDNDYRFCSPGRGSEDDLDPYLNSTFEEWRQRYARERTKVRVLELEALERPHPDRVPPHLADASDGRICSIPDCTNPATLGRQRCRVCNETAAAERQRYRQGRGPSSPAFAPHRIPDDVPDVNWQKLLKKCEQVERELDAKLGIKKKPFGRDYDSGRPFTCIDCKTESVWHKRGRVPKRCTQCREAHRRAYHRDRYHPKERTTMETVTETPPAHKSAERLNAIRAKQFAPAAFTCSLCKEEKPEGTRWVTKYDAPRCYSCNASERAAIRRQRKEAERAAAEAETQAQTNAVEADQVEEASETAKEAWTPAADPLGMMAFALDVQAALAAAEITATPVQAVAAAAVLSARGWGRS